MSKAVKTAWTSALLMVALLISGSALIVIAFQLAATYHQPQPSVAVIAPGLAAAFCLCLTVMGAWAFKTALAYLSDYHGAMDTIQWNRETAVH